MLLQEFRQATVVSTYDVGPILAGQYDLAVVVGLDVHGVDAKLELGTSLVRVVTYVRLKILLRAKDLCEVKLVS